MEMPWPILVFIVVVLAIQSIDRFIDKLFEDD